MTFYFTVIILVNRVVTHCGLRFLTVEAPPGAARPPLGDFPTLVAEAGPGILENSKIIFFGIFLREETVTCLQSVQWAVRLRVNHFC